MHCVKIEKGGREERGEGAREGSEHRKKEEVEERTEGVVKERKRTEGLRIEGGQNKCYTDWT